MSQLPLDSPVATLYLDLGSYGHDNPRMYNGQAPDEKDETRLQIPISLHLPAHPERVCSSRHAPKAPLGHARQSLRVQR